MRKLPGFLLAMCCDGDRGHPEYVLISDAVSIFQAAEQQIL